MNESMWVLLGLVILFLVVFGLLNLKLQERFPFNKKRKK